MGSNFGSSKSPASAIAANNSNGLEMLPIGSVGIVSNVYQSPDCFWTSPRSFSQPPRLRGNSAALPNGTDRTDRKDDHGTLSGLLNLESRQFNLMHCHRCKIAFKVRAFPEKLLRVTR